MAYQKKTWKDRLVEYATRRLLTNQDTQEVSVVEVARSEGTVYQEGDAFSADNMNDLEGRIDNEFTTINENLITSIANLKTTLITVIETRYDTNASQTVGDIVERTAPEPLNSAYNWYLMDVMCSDTNHLSISGVRASTHSFKVHTVDTASGDRAFRCTWLGILK